MKRSIRSLWILVIFLIGINIALILGLNWGRLAVVETLQKVEATLDGLAGERFVGRFFRGEGDVEYLRLLDVSRRMFAPDEEFQNIGMLYTPK